MCNIHRSRFSRKLSLAEERTNAGEEFRPFILERIINCKLLDCAHMRWSGGEKPRGYVPPDGGNSTGKHVGQFTGFQHRYLHNSECFEISASESAIPSLLLELTHPPPSPAAQMFLRSAFCGHIRLTFEAFHFANYYSTNSFQLRWYWLRTARSMIRFKYNHNSVRSKFCSTPDILAHYSARCLISFHLFTPFDLTK